MDLERCWMHYLKAEQLMDQGHWPEAQRLYGDVLSSLPTIFKMPLSKTTSNLVSSLAY